MDLKKRRLERSWSQQQLADISGLSVRTIQRIEKGEPAGLETLKALAASFDISSAELAGGTEPSIAPTIAPPLSAEREPTPQAETSGEPSIPFDVPTPWKPVVAHIGVYMFFLTWLTVIVRFAGGDFSLVGSVGLVWGMLIITHALTLLGVDVETDAEATEL